MKKETFYKISISILLVLNILQLTTYFIFSLQSPRRGAKDFGKKAVEILRLNEQQRTEFFTLAEKHRTVMKRLVKKQKKLTIFYLNNPSDSILTEIHKIQTHKIKQTEKHFKDIKSILLPSQKDNFIIFKKRALRAIFTVK